MNGEVQAKFRQPSAITRKIKIHPGRGTCVKKKNKKKKKRKSFPRSTPPLKGKIHKRGETKTEPINLPLKKGP